MGPRASTLLGSTPTPGWVPQRGLSGAGASKDGRRQPSPDQGGRGAALCRADAVRKQCGSRADAERMQCGSSAEAVRKQCGSGSGGSGSGRGIMREPHGPWEGHVRPAAGGGEAARTVFRLEKAGAVVVLDARHALQHLLDHLPQATTTRPKAHYTGRGAGAHPGPCTRRAWGMQGARGIGGSGDRGFAGDAGLDADLGANQLGGRRLLQVGVFER